LGTGNESLDLGKLAGSESLPIGARPASEYFKGSLDEASIQIT
jgi:hypothetical protein